MWTTLRRYKHLLGTTIARPCINKALTRIAKSENAFTIGHDATGKATTTSIPTSSYESDILENSDTLARKQIYKMGDDPLNSSTEPEKIEVNSDQEYHPSYVRKLKNNEIFLIPLKIYRIFKLNR
ncbi:argininosuccinate synthase [Bombus fervidus]|uniref:argininosuccinate synthase n=1 Tax=Bombus fervidus TaxID=203811 RepID=UPI003D18E086